jgi:hypothetical protein
MSKPRVYKSADEAINVSILAGAGRLVAVAPTLGANGEGFLIFDVDDPAKLWDFDGAAWQARVYCTVQGAEASPPKYRLTLEPFATEPS